MEMTKKLTQLINDADIPSYLKDYLLRNRQISTFFTSDLLATIEDIYIEYDSLYIFDKAEFSKQIITEIRNNTQYNSDYNSLKKGIEFKLEISSKDKKTQDKNLKESNKDILIPVTEKKIKRLISIIYDFIEQYQAGKNFKNIHDLSLVFQWYGILKMFNSVYPDKSHIDEYNEIEKLIFNSPIDLSDLIKHNKRLK